VLLLGQLTAVFVANLFWFTSAQNRLPLVVPLAFASGPALLALLTYSLQRARHVRPSVGTLATLALCALLIAQAFVPRSRARQPSAAHYYNLANVEESLGLTTQALQHYARATERNPRQPVFWLRLAHLARRADRPDVASYALSRLDALPDVPSEIRSAAAYER
jgi:tetratricopeptide (TPR) repeat protein